MTCWITPPGVSWYFSWDSFPRGEFQRQKRQPSVLRNQYRGTWLGADGLRAGIGMTCALDLSGVFLRKSPNNNNSDNSGCHSVQRLGGGSSDRVISRSPLGLLGP